MARAAMTSLAFMLVWVPEPVCQTTSGNSSSRAPSTTSWAAVPMAWASRGSSPPSCWFTRAAASFTMPRARMSGAGMRSPPMRKFCRERWVWAPQ